MLTRILDNIWLIRTCGNIETWRAMKGRLPKSGSGLRYLKFRSLNRPLIYRPDATDISVVWEVFRSDEYAVRGKWPFSSVVDCGANVGMFLGWLVSSAGFAVTKYVGIEADKSSFTVLQQQLSSLDCGSGYSIMNAAVWEYDGEVCFESSGPSWGRHVVESGGNAIPALTVESILDRSGMRQCDLLKMDIEGGELNVLPTIGKWGNRVRAIVAELHNGADFSWFASIVEPAGFTAYPAGKLFRSLPGALRNDSIEGFQSSGLLVET